VVFIGAAKGYRWDPQRVSRGMLGAADRAAAAGRLGA
jgi:hypothetical protein